MKKSLKSRIQKLLFGHHDDEGRSANESDILTEIRGLQDQFLELDKLRRFWNSNQNLHQEVLRLEKEVITLCDQLGASRTNEAYLQSEISKLQVQIETLRKSQ